MPVGTEKDRKRTLQIKANKFVEWIAENDVREYLFVEGRMVDITFKNHPEFGMILQLHLVDVECYWIVDMFLNSLPCQQFLNIVKNIDLKEDINLNIKVATDESGNKKQSLFVQQDRTPVKWYYTRANPHNLPPLQETTVVKFGREQQGWNGDLRNDFFLQMIRDEILPQLYALPNPFPYHDIFKGHNPPQNQNPSILKAPAPSTMPEKTYDHSVSDAEPVDDLPF